MFGSPYVIILAADIQMENVCTRREPSQEQKPAENQTKYPLGFERLGVRARIDWLQGLFQNGGLGRYHHKEPTSKLPLGHRLSLVMKGL